MESKAGYAAETPHDTDESGSAAPGLRKGRLGVLAIVFFVIAAVAPLGSVIGGSPVIFGAVGVTGPMMYLLVGVLFAVFSVGFVAMSRHVKNAAGFVAYIAKALGSRFGAALAGVAVLGYLALVCGLWGFFGGISELVMADFGMTMPGWFWWLVVLALVTFLCYRGIDVSLWVLGVLVVVEILALLVLAFAVLFSGGADGVSMDAFVPGNTVPSGLGIAILFAATCFTGFEATVVFSEEAKDPARTVPRAAYIAIAVIGLFYAFVTWTLAIGWGSGEVQAAAQADPVGFVFAVAAMYGPPWLPNLLFVMILTSMLAMFIGFHNLISRYLFSLGRAGMLPAAFARTSPGGTPRVAVLVFSAAVLVIVGGFVLAGADMMTVIYSWFTSLGTVGLVTVLFVTCIAILAFFAGAGRSHARLWHTRIAPVIAGLGFLAVGVLAIVNYDALLGGAGDVARWLLVLIPAAFVAGWVRASRRRAAGRELVFEDSPL